MLNKFREGVKKMGPSPLSQHGTIGVMTPLVQKFGVFPTKNWQQGQFEGWEAITGQTLTQKYLVRPGLLGLPGRLCAGDQGGRAGL